MTSEIEAYGSMILELREALKHAIQEIREHNSMEKYHHTTSEELLKYWETML
jgi:hypothetical protein